MTCSLSFSSKDFVEGPGVLVGCDAAQEWMLSWWWQNYSESNSYPVTFIDFGLSEEAKRFCEERGNRVELKLPDSFTSNKEDVPQALQELWEKSFDWRNDPFWWNKRRKCHQKPFALLLTPYEHSLWIDVDCEVCCNLSSLFEKIASRNSVYIVPRREEVRQEYEQRGLTLPGEMGYNSGLVGFHRGSKDVLRWAQMTLEQHSYFISDEDLFSRLSFLENWDVDCLEQYYNWLPHFRGFHPDAKIYHWVGNAGKFFLSLRMQNIL